MEIAQDIANILGEDSKLLEQKSLKVYLRNRLKEVEVQLFTISKKYGVKDIFDMDKKIKEGKLTESCLEDYQEMDGLEDEKDHLVEALNKLA